MATTPDQMPTERAAKLERMAGLDRKEITTTENATDMRRSKKWLIVFALGIMGFIVSLGSSATAPGVSQAMNEFNVNGSILGSLVVSIYNLGIALGPLIMAPVSEVFGRLAPYNISNVLFVLFTIGCAASPDLPALVIFRLLAGSMASATMTIGGATVADLFAPEERGYAMSIYTFGQLLGPAVGPAMGGYLTEAKGWRWVFWVATLGGAASTLLYFILGTETYTPVLQQRHDSRLAKTGNRPDLLQSIGFDPVIAATQHKESVPSDQSTTHIRANSVAEAEHVSPPTWQRQISLSVRRPLVLLFRSPIVFLFSLFIAVVYSYQFVLFVTIPDLFRDTYHFTTSQVGLAYLGIAAGFLVGNTLFGILSDQLLLKNGGDDEKGGHEPEKRLPLLIPAAFCIPVCLFVYGWTAYYGVHWIVPICSTSLLGIGLNMSIMTIQVYLVDVYASHAASALAASTIFRSLFGSFLPLVGPPLFKALGIGWGNSLLGFVALAMTSVPFLFVRYGEAIRKNPRWQPCL